MLVEGIDKVTFVNGLLRVSTTRIGASGQEESSGEIIIPASHIELIINGLANSVKDLADKIKENSNTSEDSNKSEENDKEKKKDKSN
jgi:hypothetical protein